MVAGFGEILGGILAIIFVSYQINKNTCRNYEFIFAFILIC